MGQSVIVRHAGGLGPGATFGTAAAICLVVGVIATIVMIRGASSVPPVPRRTQRLGGAATIVTVLTLAAVAALLLTTDSEMPAYSVGALGFSASAVLMAVGMLGSPAVVAQESRAALALDGVLFSLGLVYLVWAGFLEPWHQRVSSGDIDADVVVECVLLAVPVMLNAVVVGMVIVNAAHLARLRSPALLGCLGVGLLGTGTMVMIFATAAAAEDDGAGAGVLLLHAGTIAVVGGSAALAVRAYRAARAPAQPARAVNPTWLSLGAIGLAMATTVARVVTGSALDAVSIVLATLIGGFLTAQQMLARRSIKRYADRLAESEAHFRAMAHTDALTGLANRRELLRVLEEEASGGPACVLLSIDLDGFKNINDIRGHDVGDAVLVEVADRLKSNVRPGDCAARLGGDEFAVLMWARPSEAEPVARRILAVLTRPFELPSGTVFVSASIGLAGCAEADSIDSLLRNADLALRFAKQSGKNRVEAYDVAYDEWVIRNIELEHELRGAVDRGELMLVYQPVVEIETGVVVGVEALLRWHHPRLGSVSPAEFIPVAEESGLIHGLGAFVVHEAAHQLSRWLADGHELWMSVNASVCELHTPEYAQRIVDMMRSHRVPPSRLTIEVTEHAAAADAKRLIDRLGELRASGMRVALDDFGSEYSSLKLLRTLPVDALKIDRELLESDSAVAVRAASAAPPARVDGVEVVRVPDPGEATGRQAPIVDVVVTIGRRLGLDVVAEGVSTPEQRALLVEYGCRYAQGELFGGPMPAERVETLFADGPGAGVGWTEERGERSDRSDEGRRHRESPGARASGASAN
jgi:diguanylate cyclase (GGDEF)-like protein